MIPGQIFTSFAKFLGIVSVNDFWFPRRLQELLQAPFCFLRCFCFCTDRIESVELPNLAPPRTAYRLFRHSQICCYQVTYFFCSRYGCASAFSAKNPRYLGRHADAAVSVLREVSVKHCASPIPLFLATLKLTHEKNSRVRPCVLEHFRSQDSP